MLTTKSIGTAGTLTLAAIGTGIISTTFAAPAVAAAPASAAIAVLPSARYSVSTDRGPVVSQTATMAHVPTKLPMVAATSTGPRHGPYIMALNSLRTDSPDADPGQIGEGAAQVMGGGAMVYGGAREVGSNPSQGMAMIGGGISLIGAGIRNIIGGATAS